MEITSPKGRKFMSIQQMTDSIQQDLDKISKKVLEDVAKEVKEKMRKDIDLFYSQYSYPEYYERTYQLEKAVEEAESKIYKTKNGWVIRIQIFNTDTMTQTWATQKGFLNSYLSYDGKASSKGKRYTDWAIEWVEEGTIYGHSPIPFKEEINALLDEKVRNGVLREMKRAGYNLYR